MSDSKQTITQLITDLDNGDEQIADVLEEEVFRHLREGNIHANHARELLGRKVISLKDSLKHGEFIAKAMKKFGYDKRSVQEWKRLATYIESRTPKQRQAFRLKHYKLSWRKLIKVLQEVDPNPSTGGGHQPATSLPSSISSVASTTTYTPAANTPSKPPLIDTQAASYDAAQDALFALASKVQDKDWEWLCADLLAVVLSVAERGTFDPSAGQLSRELRPHSAKLISALQAAKEVVLAA